MHATMPPQGARTRGSSGATITFGTTRNNTVVKAGDKRVGEQALWLHLHASPAVPRVYDRWPTGYIMECLDELPRDLIHPDRVLTAMHDALSGNVWNRKPRITFDMDAHEKKMRGLLAGQEQLASRLADVRMNVAWDKLTLCLAHGDPTYDNVMLRNRTEVVIIDPITATHAVPDMKSVDIGKMLQSVVGFEFARYGDRSFAGASMERFSTMFNTEDWYAGLYWCTVHLIRALPYVPDTVRPRLLEITHDVLRRL